MSATVRNLFAGAVVLLLVSSGRPGRPGGHLGPVFTGDPVITPTDEDVARIAADWPVRPARGAALLDVDRDGDADVIAASPLDDVPFVVWVNDGRGRFARTVPARPASGCSSVPVVDDSPAGASATGCSSAPRSLVSSLSIRTSGPDMHVAGSVRSRDDAALRLDSTTRSTRAPPVSLTTL